MLAKEGGRGQRGVHIARNFAVLHVGIVAGAVAHHQVGVFGHHIQQRNGDLQGEVNFRVCLGELRQARYQHAARKCGGDGNLEPCAARGHRVIGEALQCAQAFAHLLQVVLSVRGERKIGATKQQCAQHLLELAHAVADRTGGDVELFGRLRHAAQAGQGFKGQQTLNGRNALGRAAVKKTGGALAVVAWV